MKRFALFAGRFFGGAFFARTALGALMCAVAVPVQSQVSVLTWHNDIQRTGQNTNETILTPANVGSTNTFGRLFTQPVDGLVYAQPLFVPNLAIPGQGTHNVIFIATEHDTVYAFDADSNLGTNGGLLWQTSVGTAAVTPNNDFGNRYGPYHDVNPEVGITSTPVIDPVTGVMYLDAFSHEGSNYFHRVHALSITNGAEMPFSPVTVAASVPGLGVGSTGGVMPFSATNHLQRPALTLIGGIVYVCYAGYADTNPYHGWVFGFNATNLLQLTNAVFCTTPNGSVATFGSNAGEGGVWMSGCGLSADASSNLYLEVGNGSFNGTNGLTPTDYGDSFLRLSPSNQLALTDYFTPFNQAALQAADTDLGSGGAVVLPDSVGSTNHPHLITGCGKEGRVYLIDRDNMGHFNSTNDSQIVQSIAGATGGMFSTPGYFNGRLYYQGNGTVMRAFAISNAVITTPAVSSTTNSFSRSTTPSFSVNGTNNNSAIMWTIQTDAYITGDPVNYSNSGPSVLHAYITTNLATELYNSSQAGLRDVVGKAVKFIVPTVANGKVYVGAQKAFSVYGNGSFLAVPTISPANATFTNSFTVTLTEATPGASVFYTLDGTVPTTNSTPYSAPFLLTNAAALSVAAFETGFVPSIIATTAYPIATTLISPASKLFTNSVTVTISNATIGAAIYYTLNGSTPTTNATLYTGPFIVTNSAFVSALAFQAGSLLTGAVATASYQAFILPYELAVLNAGPAAYWRFGETSGTNAFDFIGGFTAAYGSASVLGAAGPNYPSFDGFAPTNAALQTGPNLSFVTVPTLNLKTNAVTITAWLFPTSPVPTSAGIFFCRPNPDAAGFNFNTNNQLGYTWNSNNGATFGFHSALMVPTNQWSFTALVIATNAATIYLFNTNGQQSATNNITHTVENFSTTSYIGYDPSSTSRIFSGSMDEVAIFKYAMTPAQIQQLYTAARTPPPVSLDLQPNTITNAGFILNWPFGKLLEADDLFGPWTTNSSATPPFLIVPSAPKHFYGVLVQ